MMPSITLVGLTRDPEALREVTCIYRGSYGLASG